MKLILDTDIGSDVDDAYALAVLLSRPDVELLSITTVYGPVDLRARVASRLVRAFGREIPIGTGAGEPIGGGPVWLSGHEAENLDAGSDGGAPFEDAIGLMARVIDSAPGEATLLAIGPLTNVALLLRRHPGIERRLARLVFMGGGLVARPQGVPWEDDGASRLSRAYGVPAPDAWASFTEHNVSSDPEAAAEVLSADLPKLMVGMNVSRRATFDPATLAVWLERGGPCVRPLLDMERAFTRALPGSARTLHDPLAALAVVEPSVVLAQTPVGMLVDCTGLPDAFTGTPLDRGRALAWPEPASSVAAVTDIDVPLVRRLVERHLTRPRG